MPDNRLEPPASACGEQAERSVGAGGAEERKAEILGRARATSERVRKLIAEWENDPATQARRREARVEAAVERARAERLARERAERVEQEIADIAARSVERIVETTLQRAQELCALAWDRAPFTAKSNTGRPNIRGNCEGKALWLQRHLGGVVVTGWRTDDGTFVRHAALLVPIAGRLYIADHGEVLPLADYPFVFQGVYERAAVVESAAPRMASAPNY